jgi:hypothetical protein
MLSCRSQSLQEPLRSSASYVRQSLSAAKVISIVGEEFRDQLSLLPVVPYAVSLSLRLSYRDLRLSKTPIFRNRARRQVIANCSLLRELGDVFGSAVIIANLAEQTIREMDRVCSLMSNAQRREGPNESNVNGNFNRNGENVDATRNIDLWQPISTSNIDALDNNAQSIMHASPSLSELDYDLSTFDPSVLDNMPDMDVFEHFGSDFNLEAVDAALGDNLYSFPMEFTDFAS